MGKYLSRLIFSHFYQKQPQFHDKRYPISQHVSPIIRHSKWIVIQCQHLLKRHHRLAEVKS